MVKNYGALTHVCAPCSVQYARLLLHRALARMSSGAHHGHVQVLRDAVSTLRVPLQRCVAVRINCALRGGEIALRVCVCGCVVCFFVCVFSSPCLRKIRNSQCSLCNHPFRLRAHTHTRAAFAACINDVNVTQSKHRVNNKTKHNTNLRIPPQRNICSRPASA